MRVLIIEDDRLISRAIELMLGGAGFAHDTVASGIEGIEIAGAGDYDAIILDLTLPDLHSSDVLRRIRSARVTAPVMILTCNSSLDSKVSGSELGADDYVTKPFQRSELLARIHALVRRSRGLVRSVVTTGPISVDLTDHAVEVRGRRLNLTGKEFAILEMLSLRKGATLSKEMLLAGIYGGRDEPSLKIIDVWVCKLRRKLSDAGAGATGCIETVWGRGYVLRDPECEPAARSLAA